MVNKNWIYILTFLAIALSLTSANVDDGADAGGEGIVEIAFSFDTTGSMYPVINEVRQVVSDMIRRLQSDIPGIRIAVFAHGDWSDAHKSYATKWIDFTTDVDTLQKFVQDVERTAGGDMPEAYELVLHQVRTELTWTPGSRRSLMMIGDNLPHEANYRLNTMNIDWRNETDYLRDMGVRIYAIHALDYNTESFYRTIARKTDGFYLRLKHFDSILTFIMAISYREHGLQYLEAYEKEVAKQGKMTDELKNLFRILKEKPGKRSPRSQLDPTRSANRVTTPAPTTTTTERFVPPKLTDIYTMHINTTVSYRFATTIVTSRVANKVDDSSEVVFNIVLPKAAFITNFTMVIDGVAYPGEVKEKEAAKKTYDAARKRGQSAGHVAAKPRDSNKFKVSINVAALSKVDFELVYQELLERRLGSYRHVVHIDPGQVVRDLQVEVNIHESREITLLRVPPIQEGELLNDIENALDNPHALVRRPAPNKANVFYHPTPDQQREASLSGIQGKLIVEYDVTRTRDAGELQVVDGHFVHYIAPDGLPPSPKSVVFVLDSSGSMRGRKLEQLKDAMKTILADLRPEDRFNVLHFSAIHMFWRWTESGVYPATEENKKDAQEWIQRIGASGSTNIDLAVSKGMEALEKHANHTRMISLPGASLIIFLTDGDPTTGETNTNQILENAINKNNQRYTLFSLGFGKDMDFSFLTKLSLQNNGFARRIYADSDAALQLEGFYSEVATPTMSQVHVSYLDEHVDPESLTKTTFRDYFNGSEIIVTGSLKNRDIAGLRAQVTANTVGGEFSFGVQEMALDEESVDAPPIAGLQNNFERMWAYLTIKELFKKAIATQHPEEKKLFNEKALNMSLKYHFVTPLTSMVVVKPDKKDESLDAESKEEDTEDGVKPTPSVLTYNKVRRPPSHPSRSSSGRPAPGSFVDSDPHFTVNIQGSDTPICFDVMGQPGQIYNVVHDTVTDIIVNGLIVGQKRNALSDNGKPKTYFGKIAIYHRNISLIVTPMKIRYGKVDVQWKSNTTLRDGLLKLTLVSKNLVRISIGGSTEFVVIRHVVKDNHPVKVSFLGFYIEKDTGLSAYAHGLLGQFKKLNIGVNANILDVQPRSSAVLRFNSHPDRQPIKVTAGHRQNLIKKEVIPCWFVHNNGRYLLEGSHLDYLVPNISFRKPPTGLRKKKIL